MIDANQQGLQVGEDQMEHRQELLRYVGAPRSVTAIDYDCVRHRLLQQITDGVLVCDVLIAELARKHQEVLTRQLRT